MAEVVDWAGMYRAALDSVHLLDKGKPANESDEDWADCVDRNVEHLKLVVAKDWPESFDLTPLNDAITANA